MHSYRRLLHNVLDQGSPKPSRAGSTLFLSHQVFTHNHQHQGFPAITGRKLAFQTMAAELDCFIHGHTDIEHFRNRGCGIWEDNLIEYNKRLGDSGNTDLGPIYGRVWRGVDEEHHIDQLQWVLEEAKRNPSSRRMLVTAWIPELALDSSQCALPPCHTSFQLTINDGELDLCFYMRSVDLVLGLPFDIASYGLLQCLIANELGLRPNKLTGFLADAHIYAINKAAALEYLARPVYAPPQLVLDLPRGAPVTDFYYTMATLRNYEHGAPIKTPMASELNARHEPVQQSLF